MCGHTIEDLIRNATMHDKCKRAVAIRCGFVSRRSAGNKDLKSGFTGEIPSADGNAAERRVGLLQNITRINARAGHRRITMTSIGERHHLTALTGSIVTTVQGRRGKAGWRSIDSEQRWATLDGCLVGRDDGRLCRVNEGR